MVTYKGIVEKGRKRGTALGFPTVNIPLGDGEISGVYVARVYANSEIFEAAAFADSGRRLLEAHLLDTSADFYDQEIRVELLEKIREHQVFESDKELSTAIADDVRKAREYFSRLV